MIKTSDPQQGEGWVVERAGDPGVFQQGVHRRVRGLAGRPGFSQITIENGTGALERFLALAGRPAWEITADDVDRVIAALVARGVTQTTRRWYVQAFRGFFAFLQTRKAVEIEALFGCRLQDPLDRFNSARHVSSERPGLVPPPTVERVDAFFEFLRERLESARKRAPAARDYALFRTLYHAGLRAQEGAALEIRDVHSTAGHSGSCTSGWGRAHAGRAPGRGGCRCSTASMISCAGIWPRHAPGSGRRGRCCSVMSRAG
jgi:integrase/recombinase XerD